MTDTRNASIDDRLDAAGFKNLGQNPSDEAVHHALAKLRDALREAPPGEYVGCRATVIQRLVTANFPNPESVVSTYLPPVVASPDEPMIVARQFVDAFYVCRDRLTLHDHRGDFFQYDGMCWPEIEHRVIRAAAYKWLENAYCPGKKFIESWRPNRHKISDLVDALRAVTLLHPTNGQLEPPLWTDGRSVPPASEVISLQNGLLHVPTRQLHAHTPKFFIHHALPFGYDPAAPPPALWLEFLNQLWSDDQTSINCLQEMFGYIIGGDTRLQKMFMLVGPKRAGKGTIGRVLTGLLGSHNVAAPTMASLTQNFGLQPLINRPLALVSDARLSGRTDSRVVVERLLSISGEDSLTVDRKYREPWTGRLPSRFVILTNELPRLADSSGALASRFIVFVLNKSFYGHEDPALTDKLLREATSILKWSLDGLQRLRERGYFEPPQSGADALSELEDLTSPVGAFVRERCAVGPDHQATIDQLWQMWKQWCEGEGRGAGTKSVFCRDLKAAVPSIERRRLGSEKVPTYDGIGLFS